ncbi:MAG: hypothetical protein ACK58L_10030 [Planctomycetota bacterium]
MSFTCHFLIAQSSFTCVRQILTGLLIAAFLSVPLSAQEPIRTDDPDDMVWLSNAEVKVGLKKSSGGAIAWISASGSDRNLINAWDRGRLVQQSWYGMSDGSDWNGKPWRWNPVQGGDWKGRSSSILDQKHDALRSFVRTRPVHWATGADLHDCEMEQTIELKNSLIHIVCQFVYSGSLSHPLHHQELPALFVNADLDTLVLYDGDQPWKNGPLTRRAPGFPNEYGRITEHWVAWVDQTDHGVGLFVPVADEVTFYRFPAPSDRVGSETHASWCSYVAHIRSLAVTPGFRYSYDVWITTGSVEEIRDRFGRLATVGSPR